MKKIVIFILLAISFLGCEEYLDKVEESTGMNEEDVFTDYLNFRRFEDRMYKDMHNYLSNGDYTYIAALCDEGYLGPGWETMPTAQNGDWLRSYETGQALQFYGVWNAWESIRIINISLEKLHMLKSATQQQLDELKGQAHFMRAWYYYEFLKRQGGMPYITYSFKGSDNFALPRLSFNETALKIAADCDTAASLLPERWNNQNIGRPEKGSALAVKAAALLFSASPTNNPGNDPTRWELAAQASWDLLSTLGPSETGGNGRYQLIRCTGTDSVNYKVPTPGVGYAVKTITYPSGFDSIFLYQPYNDEIIWEYYPSSWGGYMYSVFTVPSLSGYNIIQGFTPSANFVDQFETKNGMAIEDDPDFNDQNPYVIRDPRFYHSIIFNGMRWTSQTDRYMELWAGGAERLASEYQAYAGYMARKFWGKNVDQWSGAAAPFTHTIYFRLAGMLLQYAEAANEIGGPDYTLPGASLSAVEAVNMVRNRVGMPDVNAMYLGSKEDFRKRIKNERAVELFLEGKRFFDLARWGDAHKTEYRQLFADDFKYNPMAPTGYNITRASVPFATYTFQQKHYRWPIPLNDALMFEEFKQNPGW